MDGLWNPSERSRVRGGQVGGNFKSQNANHKQIDKDPKKFKTMPVDRGE